MAVGIGIDVGATAIKGGLVSSAGKVLEQAAVLTTPSEGVAPVVGRIIELIRRFETSAAARGDAEPCVGIGLPGLINHDEGIVVNAPNMGGWQNVPVAQLVEDQLGRRPVVGNDADDAAWAEFVCGAGRGAGTMVLLTLGTGIGSGLILEGKLWRGGLDHGGEVGHTIVKPNGRRCACGQSGCLETYASAFSTARRATELIEAGEASSLREYKDRGEVLTSWAVVEAVVAGDAMAKRVWEETCECLAVACINLQRTLGPERIVFSGGMSAAGAALIGGVEHALEALAAGRFGSPPEVRIAELGNDAGFIGAALGAMA